MRPDPRTALVAALLSASLAAVSLRGALLALVALLVQARLAGLDLRALGVRLLPLLSGFLVLLLLTPLAPGAVLSVALRGVAVSAAVVVFSASAGLGAAAGLLQALRSPRSVVAFAVILGRHASAASVDARHGFQALLTRGGFAGTRGLGRSTAILLARVVGRALQRSESVAQALELRGFVGLVPGLPAWRARPADLAQGALALLVAALLAAETAWRP